MKILILCNTQDEASLNEYSFLKDLVKPRMGNHEVQLELIGVESIYTENIDKEYDCDLIIYPTKHQSKSGVHSLSVHTQGNWGKADFGGKDKDLGFCPAAWLKEGLKILERRAKDLHYEAIQECTHHGPQLSTPSFFIEIGSSIEEWENKDVGKIIAETIIELIEMKISNYKTAVGIGGLHHTPNFKKIQLETDIAIGHVVPKYNLENLDQEILLQAIEKTVPKAELVIVDWKGLGEYKERIKNILDELNIEWKKTKSF